MSGGYFTDMYEFYGGKKIEPKHGMLWNAGTVSGISVLFLLGMSLPTLATTAVGSMKWIALAGVGADIGLSGYGVVKATQNLSDSYQDNGRFELQDSWNLLSYLPLMGLVAGGVKALRGVKGAKPASAADVNLQQGASEVKTEVAGGGPKCFVAGTEILTTEGIKRIEDIQVGDLVITDDPTTPEGVEIRPVLDTFVREATELYDLYVDSEVISTTGEHPFWVPDIGWVEAKDLVAGSLLQTADGRIIDVDRVEKREGKFEVYNFNVEGIPTYFVSDLGVLVHNTCGNESGGIGNIQFGKNENQIYHTFRHVYEIGLNRGVIQDAIIEYLNNSATKLVDGLNKRSVTVDGIPLDYVAFKLPDGTINVGRITPPRQ